MSVIEQNKSYRKGLLLGFTMAEISILLIFSLLLATSFVTKKKEDQIKTLNKEHVELIEVKKIVTGNNSSQINNDDFFQELKRIKNIARKFSQIVSERNQFHQIEKLIAKNQRSNNSVLETVKNLQEEAKFSREFKNHLLNKDLQQINPSILAEILNSQTKAKGIVEEKERAITEMNRLKGQLASAQSKLKSLGKGTEMPACWADSKTGKPEYIFKVDLTNYGLIIHNQHIKSRILDQKYLPLNGVKFNRKLSIKDFLEQTYPIYKWSVDHNCRFFVLAHDSTGKNQKSTYKTMIRALEAHFYKFEI